MTDRNILWKIANSTNIRAKQRNNATITDADIKKMHYFQQAQATGQKATFYRQFCLPSQNGMPRDYDYQIAAMEFKIEQEHVNSENQMLAPQEMKENIETKMEISTKNDIIEKINKLVESLLSLLGEQSIATTKIYTVFKEYNNFSQYYNNYVNEIANDVQFRSQFINKIVQLEELFAKLLQEVSDYVTEGYTKPDVKGVSMGQIEVMLTDIMKTLTLMLDVKPTTPFVNDTSALEFGQVNKSKGAVRVPRYMGDDIDGDIESKYFEEDIVPNYGFTEQEIQDIEDGKIDEDEQKAMYQRRVDRAVEVMTYYLTQQYNIKHQIHDDSVPMSNEQASQLVQQCRIDPEKARTLWHDIEFRINAKPPKDNSEERNKSNFNNLCAKYLKANDENKPAILIEMEAKARELGYTEDESKKQFEVVRSKIKITNARPIRALARKYIDAYSKAGTTEDEQALTVEYNRQAYNLGFLDAEFKLIVEKVQKQSKKENVPKYAEDVLIFQEAVAKSNRKSQRDSAIRTLREKSKKYGIEKADVDEIIRVAVEAKDAEHDAKIQQLHKWITDYYDSLIRQYKDKNIDKIIRDYKVKLRAKALLKLGIDNDECNKEIKPVRNKMISTLCIQYLNQLKTITDKSEQDALKADFRLLGNKVFDYTDQSLANIIKYHSGDEGKKEDEGKKGDEGDERDGRDERDERDGRDGRDEGDRPDIASWPKAVENVRVYKTYISGIASILQQAGGKTDGRSNITIDSMFTTLFTPKWVKYYNKNYGRDGPKPFIPTLITDEMLTFIKDTLRIKSATFNSKAREAIKFALDIEDQ